MKRVIVVSVFSMLMTLAPDVQADDFKPYAGIGLGGYILKTGVAGAGDKTAFGGYGQLGVDVGDYFGGELRIGTSAKTSFINSGANEELRLDYIFSYLAKLQYPVTPEFRIYGLAGGSTSKLTGTLTTAGFVFAASGTNTLSETKTSFSFGGGIDYRLMGHLSIGAEYMRYYSDVSGYSGNLKYLF